MSSGRPRAIDNMHFLVPGQIDAVNKKIFSPLSSNNPLSKIALGESYTLVIDRHLDAKKKTPGMLREFIIYLFFYYFQFGWPMATLGHYRRGGLTNSMLTLMWMNVLGGFQKI